MKNKVCIITGAETVLYLIKMRGGAAVADEIELHRETKEPFM